MPQTREHEFAQLYEEYLDTLVRFAFSIVHDKEGAEDIVAGVFVALWQSGKEWDRAGIRPYLFASVRNRVYTYLRAEKRASAAVSKMVETSDELILPDDLAEQTKEQRIDLIRGAIAKLPEQRRSIMILYWEQGLTVAEIASIMGMSPGAVDQSLSRSAQALRRVLGEK